MMHHHYDQTYLAAIQRERIKARCSYELHQVVDAAKQGDRGAWSEIVARFRVRVRQVARACSLPGHDVDDVEQATWARLLENIGSIRNPAALGAWLETTAHRESLRTIHRHDRERPTDDELLTHEVVEPVAEQHVVAAERSAAVAAALERLPRQQRELLSMLAHDPCPPYREISRALRMPTGSIGPTRARAIDRLRGDRRLAAAVSP
jgi:RNA polymerase sigma factor (sigma-70 family)